MKKLRIWISFAFLIVCLTGCNDANSNIGGNSEIGAANVPPKVERWRSDVENYARKYGIEEYVELILAIIAQESGGDSERIPDIMQSSESVGSSPNTITDPQKSMDQGIKYLASLLEQGKSRGVDMDTIIQSYNFGGGFIDYIAKNHNGTYSKEAAASFSRLMCQKYGWNNYGDVLYVEHVRSKLKTNTNGIHDFSKLETAFLKYQGVPYLYGGSSMSGIDCSALTQLSYREIGVTLPRTAQEQYNKVKHVSSSEAKPGDLVFFKGTSSHNTYITHVGIFVGNNQMFHASSKYNSCRYANIDTPYYKEHLVAFGRVK